MVNSYCSVFLVNLVQDVNILRPLIHMCAVDLKIPTEVMVSKKFVARDTTKSWQTEIRQLCAQVGAIYTVYESVYEARKWLENKSGYLVAGSESNLDAHDMTRDVFRSAPSAFTCVTLQHGYECVGMLQSKQHNIAHGEDVTFAADVVCGWFKNIDMMRSMSEHQKSKVWPAGPTSLLQQPNGESSEIESLNQGLICENLHSTRLNVSGDLKVAFIEQFSSFCEELKKRKKKVALRPHPGGQYTVKNKQHIPANVTLVNDPIYKVDLRAYSYGISAPSSVLIDMLLAQIPVAVWRDQDGVMDSDNYSGLTEVSSLEDWLFFSEDAVRNKEKYLRRQQKFLENLDLITNVQEVYANYRSLFQAREHYREGQKDNSSKERVVYVANDLVPTLQLSFLKPFNDDREKGLLDEMFILESDLNQKFNKEKDISVCSYLGKVLTEFNPTIIVFCRYSGPHCAFMRMWAKQRGIPTIYHIDDDLLSIPKDIGIKKYQYHNSAGRIKTVRYLLDHVDYIYCSTKNLTTRLEELGVSNTKQAGKIYCSGSVIEQAIQRETIKIGYMASADHAHNMQVVLPAIVKLLEKHPQVQFEFFGSIPTPIELQKFSGRISTAPPVRDYGSFLQEFSKRKWDVGICPLTPIPFNLMKANTKWIEYTSVGAAVVASRDTVYDDCCADECGLLASTPEEWFEHLDSLVTDANYRYKIVSNAQHKLINEYSEGHLKSQVLGVYKNARRALSGE